MRQRGVQLLTLAVVGEYPGRNDAESKPRPLYFIEERRPARTQARSRV